MELYLIRHAEAADAGDDFSRPLTGKGRRQAEAIGACLRKLAAGPLLMAASPALRACDTARIVCESLGNGTEFRRDGRLAPGMTIEAARAVVHELGAEGERLALVGHAPDMECFAAHLIKAAESGIELKKGAVAAFETSGPGLGASFLKWLIVPELVS